VHLGQHRGGRDRHRALVGLDLAPHLPRRAQEVVPTIEDHHVGPVRQGLQRAYRGTAQRLRHADLVDLLGLRRPEGVPAEPARQDLGERLPMGRGQQLGVGQPHRRAPAPRQHRRRAQIGDGGAHDDRAGPRAPADLVHPGDPYGPGLWRQSRAELLLDLIVGVNFREITPT
jgi:hypothetical protein